MNEPLQNKEERHNSPSAEATIHDRTGLYLSVIAIVIASLALGMEIVQPRVTDAKIGVFESTLDINSNRAQVSENHWRDIEVQTKITNDEIEKLKQEIHSDRRR